MTETGVEKQAVAVIDIGSSAIRMLVAEVGPKTEIRNLENLQKPVRFGKDVFTTGRLSNETIRDGIDILKNFKSIIDGYGIKTVHAVATSAIRDAVNRDNFVDQVFVRTGIDVEVIEGPEENRLQLLAAEHALEGSVDLEKKNCLILEVGSGSTELILMDQGKVDLTRTIPMGSIRLPGETTSAKTKVADVQRILNRSIREITKHIARECSLDKIDTFIAMGSDMRFAARQITESTTGTFTTLEAKVFQSFVTKISKLAPEELVSQYGMPITNAESVGPALLFNSNYLAQTKAETVIVPMASIRDGLLLETAQMFSGYKRSEVARQVINSARHLGKKFQYDEPHALYTAALAVKLFDMLKEDHGLAIRGRLLLETSAILHDIGTFISLSSHHKHSSYLIDASEIFGLRKADKNIVSAVARYHRRSVPKESHVAYMSLPKNDRAIVSKLAAILRVVDALDRSHQQKIKDMTLEKTDESYNLWVDSEAGDLSLEREALEKKGDLFSDVFGFPLVLKQGTPPKK